MANINDTYAVVNKARHRPPTDVTYSEVASPRCTRSLPSSHLYENDSTETSAAPVYSRVQRRAKVSATPIYDITEVPANHGPEEGMTSLHGSVGSCRTSEGERLSSNDYDYEDLCSTTDTSTTCPPGGIGFNYRIQKPKGPREPPAEWTRLER